MEDLGAFQNIQCCVSHDSTLNVIYDPLTMEDLGVFQNVRCCVSHDSTLNVIYVCANL